MKLTESEGNLKVLVVDDDDKYCELLERWVTSMGHHCMTAADGQKAVDCLRNSSCDLVLTDMVMPNMDGLQLLRHIKEKYNDISVIVLTGYSKDYSFTDVIKAGASDFIEKPTGRDELEAKINRILYEKTLRNSYQDEIKIHQVLIDLLNLSIGSKEMDELLNDFLVCITSFPWLELEPRGAAFLIDEMDENILELKAHHNLDNLAHAGCSRVHLGECLCGKAAITGELVFSNHPDTSHDNKFKSVPDHGQYCVPITLTGDKILGVFTLYTKAEAKRNENVVAVLNAAAKTLARIITGKMDEAIIVQQDLCFRSMTENVLDAIIMMDNKGRISFWNNAAERIFGFSASEVTGQNLHKMIVPERYQAQYRPALKEFFRSGSGEVIGKTIEVSGRHKSGKTIPVELSLSGLHVQGMWQAVGIIRDISARKTLETEKEKLNQQLRQAQKMEAIGTLAGGIAHDFNNILGAIIGFADMAKDDVSAGSQVYKDLDRILSAGNRAKELVTQILTFSRQAEEEFTPVKLHLILKEALKMLRASIPTNIEIRQSINAECKPVLADPTQLHQVIMNLMTNAYHAMLEKGGIISVDLKEEMIDSRESGDTTELENGLYVKMIIADTGTGMESEVLERIFDPFFTTKAQGVGTGMGLSLVHGIIVQLGGKVDVKSETGKGSSFEIYIPAFLGFENSDKKLGDNHIPGGEEHILIVDDELALIEVSSRKLKKLGYIVTSRTSSIEALEAFKAQPNLFDLIITDLAMPNMTGLDMAIEMLRLKPEIPIILSTGFVDSRTSEYAMEIGIRKIVNKPVSSHVIALAIREALQRNML